MGNKEGLTILECLISIIILAIMLTAGMAFCFNSQAELRWSIHKRIAIEVAGSELEKIKNNGYGCLPDPASGLWDKFDNCNNELHSKNVVVGHLTGQQEVYVYDVDYNGGGIDYKRVHVEVSWKDDGRSDSSRVSLDTYIAPS